MSRNASGFARLPIAALALALFGQATPAIAEQRPLEDFLARQSTWCLVPNERRDGCGLRRQLLRRARLSERRLRPDVPSVLDQTRRPRSRRSWTHSATFDEGSLGTSVTGSISEGGGPHGSAQVSVKLDTANALVRAFDPEFAPLFGFGPGNPTWPDTLGDASVHLTFKNTARGAVLPDMAQLDLCPEPGQVQQMLSISAHARGPLRAASGLPEGTPGRMHMTGHVNRQRPGQTSSSSHPDLDPAVGASVRFAAAPDRTACGRCALRRRRRDARQERSVTPWRDATSIARSMTSPFA